MTFQDLKNLIIGHFGELILVKEDATPLQPSLTVPTERIAEVCQFLRDHEQTYFDYLSCLTGIDNGPQQATMEIIYNLYSIPYDLHLTVKIIFNRNQPGEPLPKVPTVSGVWRTADWHERETYDLLGIEFTGHPDLRRILLPADWEGYPLRKDYQLQEYYHDIKVKY